MYQGLACIAPTHDEAVAELDAMLLSMQGVDLSSMSKEDADGIRAIVPHGDPDEIGEIGEIFSGYLATGVDGFTVAAPVNAHIEGRVTLLGETFPASSPDHDVSTRRRVYRPVRAKPSASGDIDIATVNVKPSLSWCSLHRSEYGDR